MCTFTHPILSLYSEQEDTSHMIKKMPRFLESDHILCELKLVKGA